VPDTEKRKINLLDKKAVKSLVNFLGTSTEFLSGFFERIGKSNYVNDGANIIGVFD
jgi:hypothetical protein